MFSGSVPLIGDAMTTAYPAGGPLTPALSRMALLGTGFQSGGADQAAKIREAMETAIASVDSLVQDLRKKLQQREDARQVINFRCVACCCVVCRHLLGAVSAAHGRNSITTTPR